MMVHVPPDPVFSHERPPLPIRDEENRLSRLFLAEVSAALEAEDAVQLRHLVEGIHEADLGETLRLLSPTQQTELLKLLGSEFNFVALTETDEATRTHLLEHMSDSFVAQGISTLESDDAVFILEELDENKQKKILSELPTGEQTELRRVLNYPDHSAGRHMQTDFVAVPVTWNVGETIDYLRECQELPNSFYQIYGIDSDFHVIGDVALSRLLRSKRHVGLREILQNQSPTVSAWDDREEVARLFELYNLISVPVVDEARRLIGVLTIDDMVDVIQEETEEDFRALAGVGDEELSDSVAQTLRGRFTWLFFNLGTAALSSFVIRMFEGTIGQMVALAVLMPIVASLGGNSGTQTMTVAVRALATGDLSASNAWRIIRREVLVGGLNGGIFALLTGIFAALLFSNLELGGVIAAAMVVNMTSAALAGILIPLSLEKLGADPAIASGVFVTAITDVVGFFSFLALAAWWFGLPF